MEIVASGIVYVRDMAVFMVQFTQKRQHQRCDNSVITLAILFLLKTMDSLQNGFASHFQVSPSSNSIASITVEACWGRF